MARLLVAVGVALIRPPRLLGPAQIRELAGELGMRPTKTLGQNFVHDGNTVRRIVSASGVDSDDVVVEVGPGLGSLTLALVGVVAKVVAVEIDPVLAERLPRTVAEFAPDHADRLTVITADAMSIEPGDFSGEPTALVANLPYNVAVPVLLHLLSRFPSIATVLVMVQLEVAQRLAAIPGSRVYGVPSVKARFYGSVRRAGTVGRNVFWPEPNVESGLVRIDRYQEPDWPLDDARLRADVFAVIDAAFAQRRKMLRAALTQWAGSSARAQALLVSAGIDPTLRGERLDVTDYVRLARVAEAAGPADL